MWQAYLVSAPIYVTFPMNLLNNREEATLIWVAVFGVWALTRKTVRASIWQVFRSFAQRQILIVSVVMISYIAIVVLALYEVNVWRASLAKDTCLWVFGSAFVLVMNLDGAREGMTYFGRMLIHSLRVALVVEFVVGLYPFNLLVEMILVPLLFVLGALRAVAGMNEEYAPVRRGLDFVLAVIGFALLAWTSYAIVHDFHSFASQENFRRFLLPPVLTLAFLPFMYALALYMAYEILFVRLDAFTENKKLARQAKRRIIALCGANLERLGRFSRGSVGELMNLKTEDDVLSMIHRFRSASGKCPARESG